MIIDVAVSSCARPDVLADSLDGFLNKIKTKDHEYRFVIVEDKVDDPRRQEEGMKFIESRKGLFNQIIYSNVKLGLENYMKPFKDIIKSKLFIHLQDDERFLVEINIDPIIRLMEKFYFEIIQIVFNKGIVSNDHQPLRTFLSYMDSDGKQKNMPLTQVDFFSCSTGIKNTSLFNNLLRHIGNKPLHEIQVLTPASRELGYKKYVLDHDKLHYLHMGNRFGYQKGSWKKEF